MMTQIKKPPCGPNEAVIGKMADRDSDRNDTFGEAGTAVPPHGPRSTLTPLPQIAKATRYPY